MTSTRVGFVTQTHTGAVTPIESIQWAADLGYDFVEIYMDGASERTRLDREAITEALEQSGVDCSVHLPFVDLDLGTPRNKVREGSIRELRACLDAAADLGAEKAVLHASTHATEPEWSERTTKPRILASVRELEAYATARGIELCVENLPDNIYSIHTIEEVLAETDASLTVDTGHARVSGFSPADTAAFLDEHRDRVSHIHVNDARQARDEHVPVGSGTTDFETIFAPLESNWEGTFSVEAYTFDKAYMELSKAKLDACLGS
ncbi:sugar phosphate isomerase/epimerase [Halohasta litchfieldiae]|jgi:sugar phosphate isomerase/epimerase|uniref:Sugar phosphate isomerase/epimerase n=1 Tax=Halohasta litchfieldiae TaxID=1073996 RepID=A0A1H6QT57_9EURY|nr:sugar phosphate isomerase/epimerase family protein [Halohasta litchfieldiae]ATW88700.1 sugar phosphate isomerase/epimerase [Halohasta litchfieldiae]SEI46799.1 Sugar phosphate isomerase/epimerase [Halohasta litchfieldiae]